MLSYANFLLDRVWFYLAIKILKSSTWPSWKLKKTCSSQSLRSSQAYLGHVLGGELHSLVIVATSLCMVHEALGAWWSRDMSVSCGSEGWQWQRWIALSVELSRIGASSRPNPAWGTPTHPISLRHQFAQGGKRERVTIDKHVRKQRFGKKKIVIMGGGKKSKRVGGGRKWERKTGGETLDSF